MARGIIPFPSKMEKHRTMARARSERPARGLAATLMLPREHGAWAMLLMPFLVGSAAGGWGGLASLLLLASMLLLFTSSRALEVLLETRHVGSLSLVGARPEGVGVTGPGLSPASTRQPAPARLLAEVQEKRRLAVSRFATYAGLGALAAALLLYGYQRWALVAIGNVAAAALIVQLFLRHRRLDRTWPARLLSIAALSAAGPAAYYTASGALDRHAAAAWVMAFLYSGASVFYVRLCHPQLEKQKPGAASASRARARRQLLVYLGIGASAMAGLSALDAVPPLGALAFSPLVAKVAWASTRRDHHPSLKRIGFMEIGHTTLFALLAAATIATW